MRVLGGKEKELEDVVRRTECMGKNRGGASEPESCH